MSESDQRCCFCFGLSEAGWYVFDDGRYYHRECLPAVLRALGIPQLTVSGPDGPEVIVGFQSRYPWPV